MTFDHDLFDGYHRDELAPDERARLEERLRLDRARGGDFAREWDAYADAELALAREAVRGRAAAARARYGASAAAATDGPIRRQRDAVVRPLWRRHWLASAATVLLLVLAGGYYVLGGTEAPRTPAALAEAYFEPAIGLPTLLGPSAFLTGDALERPACSF